MAKKGFVASAVRAAVTAAEKAMAPSPFAKKVMAAAAAEAVRQFEQRAPEMLAPIEKKLRKNAGELAKPVDRALAAEKAPPKRKPQKSSRAKAGARKSAASRKKSKSSRARASAVRKTRTSGGKKAAKAKRR